VFEIPIFEYLCNDCGYYEEKLEFGKEMDKEHICPKCEKVMDKLISKSRFELKYNNKTDMCSWGNDGYSSSHYWDAYRAARANGQNVKPAGED